MNDFIVKLTDDGNPPRIGIASIIYENQEGLHVFSSDDIDGFMVASRDPCKALKQIRPTITELLKRNYGLSCFVELGEEFRQFERLHTQPPATRAPALKNTYAVIRDIKELEAA